MPLSPPANKPAPPGQESADPLHHDGALSFRAPETADHMRLDAALGLFLPDLGLRARRRLWSWRRVSVNGKPQKAGFLLRAGDLIEIGPAMGKNPAAAPEEHCGGDGASDALCLEAGLLSPAAADGNFIAFHKKAGVHTAHIAGGADDSLEGRLARLWPLLQQKTPPEADLSAAPGDFSVPRLLTRLDRATSGLVLAAKNLEAERKFRALEQEGQARKLYLALVRGRLEKTLHLCWKLNVDGGRLSRVLPREDPDPARHSYVRPLHIFNAEECRRVAPSLEAAGLTLTAVEIARGARHQIRAHLAHAGFPVVGEWLYAPQDGAARLFLHHARLRFPGFSASCEPEWSFIAEGSAENSRLRETALEALA